MNEYRPDLLKILILDEDYRRYQELLLAAAVMSDAGSDADAYSGEYDILLAQPNLAASYLQRGHNVSWIQSTWAGIDGLAPAVQSSNTVVTGVKDIFGPQMAEYVFAFLLQKTRALPSFSEQQSKGLWSPRAPGSLVDQSMLILGVGTIGTHIAGVAKAFGMKTLGVSRHGQPAQDFDRVVAVSELATVVAQANVLINTLPSTEHTRGIIDGQLLQALPADATVFNLGRGDALCEEALRVWLDTHEEVSAVLDVFAVEPLPLDHWMWQHPRVSITPHIAAVSFPQDVIRIFLANLQRWREGHTLAYVIDPKRGY